MQRIIVIVILFLLSTSVLGCNGISSDEKDAGLDKINDRVIESDNTLTDKEFLHAIKQLKPDSELDDELIMEMPIQQLKIEDDRTYFIGWAGNMISSPDLPIVIIFNEKKEVIFAKTFRERIESVKYIEKPFLDHGLIEVTSYGATGSFSGQLLNLFLLENNVVKEVWEYQTLSNDSHVIEDNKLEYIQYYSTYLILPSYQQRLTKEPRPEIIVHVTAETIHILGEEGKIVSREKSNNEIIYFWDKQIEKFVEQKAVD